MHWKAHLDHLIADGEHAAYLESREVLEALLAQPLEERWQVILARDLRLERLSPTDYQWLLKATASLKSSAVEEALAGASVRWEGQWKQHAEHLHQRLESLLARLRVFLLVFSLALIVLLVPRSDSTSVPEPSDTGRALRSLTGAVESLQTHLQTHLQTQWNAAPEGRTHAERPTDVRSSDPRSTGSGTPAWLLGLLILSSVAFSWWILRSKFWRWLRMRIRQRVRGGSVSAALSPNQWGERLEQRSDDLMDALESSQSQINTRLEQVLRETTERQERQREFLWRVMAMEELGLKLIDGSDFHAELMALRAIWVESEVLPQLKPMAIRGVPGRPLLLVTLEHLYGELLIQREEQEQTKPPLWDFFLHKKDKMRGRMESINKQVTRALEELRRGQWEAAIQSLSHIEYEPVQRWRETAKKRLDLEQWYVELRQEIWAGQSRARTKKKAFYSQQCAKTCKLPFCKSGKWCLKQVVTRSRTEGR